VCTKVPPVIEKSWSINLANPVFFSFYQGSSESEGPLVKVMESFLDRAGFQKHVTFQLVLKHQAEAVFLSALVKPVQH